MTLPNIFSVRQKKLFFVVVFSLFCLERSLGFDFF